MLRNERNKVPLQTKAWHNPENGDIVTKSIQGKLIFGPVYQTMQ